jgi:hypothetical protein
MSCAAAPHSAGLDGFVIYRTDHEEKQSTQNQDDALTNIPEDFHKIPEQLVIEKRKNGNGGYSVPVRWRRPDDLFQLDSIMIQDVTGIARNIPCVTVLQEPHQLRGEGPQLIICKLRIRWASLKDSSTA